MGCKVKGLIIFSIIVIGLALTVFAAQFIDDTQEEFDTGTYSNTVYNGSAVVLFGQNTSGTYTSVVFDAGSDATWNNLTWQGNNQEASSLYAVDGAGDVYYSADSVTWSQKADNYGRTTDTIEMFSDNNYLYIIANSNREVWRSTDGESWAVINDSFVDSGLLVGEVDSNGNLFVADASGDVYTSLDFGVSWTKKGDFNGGATNNAKGMGINTSNAIFVVDGSGAVFESVDGGGTWTEKNSGYGGGLGTDDLEVDSSGNIYILFNKEVYKSIDLGVSWSVINDSFTPYSNDGLRMLIDGGDNFYIADGVGRIFKSIDSGISWIERGDFNSGASNNPKGLAAFSQDTNISVQVRNCSISGCSDVSYTDVNLDNINLTSRYFQYKVNFSSPSAGSTSELMSVTIDYTLLNQQPIVSSLSLTPASLKTVNDLTCSFTITDVDVGDSLTANITWYRNSAVYSSISQAVTNGTQASSILDASNTAKNEEWNCTVIPYDGTAYGAQDSNKVIVQNSQPTAPNISITPASPITTNDLNIVFNAVSEDNDSDVITYSYEWYKDDVLQPGITGSTVSNGVTSKNEIWKVVVTPNDGEEDGTSAQSNVTIQNSLPSITSASLNPTSAYESTTLTVSTAGWSDLDGESENYIYQWFNQNGLIAGATSSTLTGTDFNKSDTIYCNVTPYDSDDYGTSKLTNNVTIQNSLPTLTISIVSELGFNGTDEDLIGSFSYTDGDSDSITANQTKWYKNSVEQIGLENLTTISYTYTSAEEIWIFSARVYDGESWSNWHNTSITILDVSQTYPVLVSPANGTYFNVSSVVLTYTAPNYINMDCTIFADTNPNPQTSIKNNTNLQGKTMLIYNWINLVDNRYYWRVSCTNDTILLNSTTKTFVIDTTYPTSAPNLTQVSDSDNDGNIELSWTADPDATTYNIYRSATQIIDASNLIEIGVTSLTSWEDNTTQHSSTYWYALTTVDGAGNENKSIVSESFNATSNDAITPKMATRINATSSNGVTTIYWTKVIKDIGDNSDEFNLKYKVWYRQASTVNLSKAFVNETADYIKIVEQDSCVGTLCQTSHSLSGSAQYYYFITTIDDANNENLTLDSSVNGNSANVTITLTPPPGGSGGGGGGGSRGVETLPEQEEVIDKDCMEEWSCSKWYGCVNGVQARTCVDINRCGTSKNKPDESRSCAECEEEWQCGDWTPCVNNRQTRVCIEKNECETEEKKPIEEKDCMLDTCSDGIKNYGEVRVDCGGPCKPCKASDFITGAAISLKETDGPNKTLLIPTIFLLIAFLVIKTVRKSDMKFKKIVSALHIPIIITIVFLFFSSFFGARIVTLFSQQNEVLDDLKYQDDSKDLTQITSLDTVEVNITKAKITSAIFFMVICLLLTVLVVKNRFSGKQRTKIQNTIKENKLDFENKIKDKPTVPNTDEVETILKELDSLKVKKGDSAEKIKTTSKEIMPLKIDEKKIDESSIHKVQTKKEILEHLKDTYELGQLNEKNEDFPGLIEK